MPVLEVVGLLAGVATFVGLAYAILAWRRDKARGKRIVFDVSGGPPLARSRSLGDYELEVSFRRGATARKVSAAFATYTRVANLGTDPVRRDDIAPANPVRLVVVGAAVLSMEIEKVTRSVCQIALNEVQGQTDSYEITFDYLDRGDGALIRVLTDGRPEKVEVVGDIIGMPSGIRQAPSTPKKPRALTWAQVAVTLLVFLAPQAAIAFFYVRGVGGRPIHLLWLLAPLAALVASISLAVIIDDILRPSEFDFPPTLMPKFIFPMSYAHHYRDRLVLFEGSDDELPSEP